ncbi:hypothetical protein PICMEDRAFT_116115 [Pichia membranifaciens NRRL Y-2026]|uniref:Uncharacterized protein n=1 Tax=Pichia membranifaciens NRRL Y-2026 TaxID=763406 RepID=A0A1E3NN90_9ASCO|nr:hypothetical protein PICMEDRAFT_116115 [Pichia membranifaciens NRRL Y-2026]ODQ47576.1 hypothetical protein PICMEDRAFT_116115 [Pichia membranifaciens NRRL Y-2026]
MDQHDLDLADSKIDKCFSVVEFNLNNHTPQFASNFAMEYYIRKIQRCGQYRVAHLTSFLYDTDRIRHIVDHMPLVSPTLHDRLSENVLVWQCLSLAQVHDIVNELLLSFSGSSASEGSFNLVVIEDLDEAFNIGSFENYILDDSQYHANYSQALPNIRRDVYVSPAQGENELQRQARRPHGPQYARHPGPHQWAQSSRRLCLRQRVRSVALQRCSIAAQVDKRVYTMYVI